MAVSVWITRQTKFNGGRMGAVRVADADAADLIKKGDALPFDKNLRRALAEFKANEREAAEAAEAPKSRGRPRKAKQPDEPDPDPQAGELGPDEQPAQLDDK